MAGDLAVTEPEELLKPIKVQKAKSTGTKELRAIGNSLEAAVDLLTEFRDRILRGEEKAGQISDALLTLAEAIKETGELTPDVKDILKDIDANIFQERFYTEKANRGVIRMTDATMMALMDKILNTVSKVSATKHRMSSGDYTPTATVVQKAQQTVDEVSIVLKEHLGPVAGQPLIDELLERLVVLWNE